MERELVAIDTEDHSSRSDPNESNEIILMSEEDDSFDFNAEVCFVCLGSDDWHVPDAWIGCSAEKCQRWFHKMFINNDCVMSMTQEELESYDFYCKTCSIKSQSDLLQLV